MSIRKPRFFSSVNSIEVAEIIIRGPKSQGRVNSSIVGKNSKPKTKGIPAATITKVIESTINNKFISPFW